MIRLVALLLSLCILLLTGCAGTETTGEDSTNYQVIDECGRVLQLQGRPQRIFAGTTSLEEVLIDLVGPQRLVAISAGATDPSSSLISDKAKDISHTYHGRKSIEGIVALNPDLVVIQDNMNKEYVKALQEAGLNLYITHVPLNTGMIKERIRKLAAITGEKARGERLVSTMEGKLEIVERALRKLPREQEKIVMAYSSQGVFGSRKGLFNNICVNAHVINGAALAGLEYGEHLSKEKIVEYNPDLLVFPQYNIAKQEKTARLIEEVLSDPALQGVKAVREKQVLIIKERYRSTTSHYVGDAVLSIAQSAYPEYFQEVKKND